MRSPIEEMAERVRSGNGSSEDLEKAAKVLMLFGQAAIEKGSGSMFICGTAGKTGPDGMPPYIQVCPTYGSDWVVMYKRVESVQ